MKPEILEAGHVARMARVRQAPAAVATHGIFKDMMTVILLFLALRGALFGFIWVGRSVTQSSKPSYYNYTRLAAFWDGWIRYDSGWFMKVVKHGYHLEGQDPRTTQSDVAFFPLYPYTIRAAMKLVGGRNHWYAGLLISNVSTVF